MEEKRDAPRDGIPDRALLDRGEGGLERLTVTTPLANAQVYLHGAHITHFQPVGEAPLLFLSSATSFANDKAIRGGVPVIFPWFGPREGRTGAPMHGFVRIAHWELEALECAEDDRLTATFRYAANEATRAQWAHEFELRYRITFGTELRMALEVKNTSDTPFTFEEALHTYLAIGDIGSASVFGLNGVNFIDKTDGGRRKRQQDEALRFTAETDRVYLSTHGACLVKDPVLGREILIEKSGSESTVIWNPWSVKGAAMTDLGKDEWTRMICVETANAADNAVTISPGAERTMETIIRIARD